MPSNHSHVCFDCRKTFRRPKTHAASVMCSECRGECVNLGYKIPMPPKDDKRAWRMLRESQTVLRRERADVQFEAQVRAKHDLEKQILELKQQPENADRTKAIRQLEERLAGGK